jgi:transketolase
MEFPVSIENQEQFDALVKNRLTRERERWEKETNIDEYRQRAESAESAAFSRVQSRDARQILHGMNVPKERHGRILKLAEMPTAPGEDGEPDRKAMIEAFKDLHGDMPEVFGAEATVAESALDTSTGERDTDAPLTLARIESMDAGEINEPSMWERVQRFMAGERA